MMGSYEPCPRCGAKRLREQDALRWARVICAKCGAEGPKAQDPHAARKAWNELSGSEGTDELFPKDGA